SLSDNLDEAVKLYQEIAKAEPDDGTAMLRLGQIYRRQMKYDQARQSLQKAAQAAPDDIQIQFNFVLLERDEGRLGDAAKRANDFLIKTEKPGGLYSEPEKQNRRIFLINEAILQQTME